MELQLPFTGQDPLDLLQVVYSFHVGGDPLNVLLCCLVHAFLSVLQTASRSVREPSAS